MRTAKCRVLLSVLSAGFAVQAAAQGLSPSQEIVSGVLAAFDQLPPPPGGIPPFPPPPGQGGRLPPPPDDRRGPPPDRDRRDRDGRGRDGSLPMPPGYRPDAGFYFDRIRDLERNFERADADYRSASSNSWAEQRADRERREAASMALSFAREMRGSRVDFKELETFFLEYDAQYRSAPSNSFREEHYGQMRDAGYDAALAGLDEELSSGYADYRAIDRWGDQYDAQFRSMPSNSKRETFYDEARRKAYPAAERELRRYASRASRFDLRRIGDEYDAKYRSAPSNSLRESHYRQMRDIASY
ncbi:MAG: hypothetical protein HY925_08225 [Elusimicrobia bacterium]|nr:hypothetical protein [Elusimicrobiota bacterium]